MTQFKVIEVGTQGDWTEGGGDFGGDDDPNFGRTGDEIGGRPKEGNKFGKDSGAMWSRPFG